MQPSSYDFNLSLHGCPLIPFCGSGTGAAQPGSSRERWQLPAVPPAAWRCRGAGDAHVPARSWQRIFGHMPTELQGLVLKLPAAPYDRRGYQFRALTLWAVSASSPLLLGSAVRSEVSPLLVWRRSPLDVAARWFTSGLEASGKRCVLSPLSRERKLPLLCAAPCSPATMLGVMPVPPLLKSAVSSVEASAGEGLSQDGRRLPDAAPGTSFCSCDCWSAVSCASMTSVSCMPRFCTGQP